MEKAKKPFYKKWWFWLIVVAIIIGASQGGKENSSENKSLESKTNEKVEDTKKEIELIKLDVRSPYRTVKTLNKDTDSPNDEILYKLPEGKYKLTTDFEKIVTLAVVKEEINEIGGDYPEELIYVSDMMQISAKPEDFKKGFASKEVVIEIKNGELLSIPNDNTVFAEKQ